MKVGAPSSRPVGLIFMVMVVVVASSVVTMARTGQSVAASDWRVTRGKILEDGRTSVFNYWQRGTREAVYVEFYADLPIKELRCEAAVLHEAYAGAGQVVRDGLGADECFKQASAPLLDYGRLAHAALSVPTGEDGTGRLFDVTRAGSPVRRLVLDREHDLPLRAEFGRSRVVEWQYDMIDAPVSAPPETPPELVAPTEFYVSLTSAQAAAKLGTMLPSDIDGLPLVATFDYAYNALASTYAIWRAESGREVQLIITAGSALEQDGLSEEDGSFTLHVQDHGKLVQVIASDLAALRTALADLRPDELHWLDGR